MRFREGERIGGQGGTLRSLCGAAVIGAWLTLVTEPLRANATPCGGCMALGLLPFEIVRIE